MASDYQNFFKIFVFLWEFLPFWLPILTAFVAWEVFVNYAETKFGASKQKILLEIKLPLETVKSPVAMELVITALHLPIRETTFIDRKFKGQSRPRFSMEIVSLGGKVHFYIWTEKDFKNAIETQIYSQYPNVEVHEVPDYAQGIKFEPGVNDMHAVEYIKDKSNPIPIKTYISYGLDTDPKEEYKIDPITPLIEYMGSLKTGEQAWLQIIVRAHKKEETVYVKGERKKVDWTHAAAEEKKKILESLKEKTDDDKTLPTRRMTKGEEEVVTAIERNISKLPFDVGIRALYIAPKEIFSPASRAGIMGCVKQFNSNNLNNLKPNNSTNFNYPWEDVNNIRLNSRKASMLNYYRSRRYFDLHKCKKVVMNSEELATLYHFPGSVSMTPSLSRIMSKKAEAPANLPM